MLFSASFTAKSELVFVLTLENVFYKRFYFKANRKSIGFLKNGARNFQNSPPFERSASFQWKFWTFSTFQLKNKFSGKQSSFSLKLDFRFLVESTKIENTSFSYKTAMSAAYVKINRMVSTKWTYHKEWSFASKYLVFLKILFQYENLLKRAGLMYQRRKCS